jgi:hypothetical protein
LQLHKVGLRRVPKFLKEVIETVRPMLGRIPLQLISRLVDGMAFLPKTFYPEFRNELLARIMQSPKKMVRVAFPYRGFPSK